MIKFKGNAICLTVCGLLLAGALLGGCSLPASENTEHAADTAQETAAQTYAELIKTVFSEKTFYNQIGKSLDDLPVTELSDVLSTIGADGELDGVFLLLADAYGLSDVFHSFRSLFGDQAYAGEGVEGVRDAAFVPQFPPDVERLPGVFERLAVVCLAEPDDGERVATVALKLPESGFSAECQRLAGA